jgi:hypothetical protein
MNTSVKAVSVLVAVLLSSLASAQFDHSMWDELLNANVIELREGRATQVDYDAMLSARTQLRGYLDKLATVAKDEFEQWSHAEQLAFLINAYNAWTVEFVLTEYPALDSIKDLGSLFSSPWSQNIVSLFGQQVSLDDIEHGMIRGWNRYNEPRIHFAVNCAAIGCPALAASAFTGENLESQLDLNTKRFLADDTRNYYQDGRFYLSKIFDWYEEDFEKGWGGYSSLAEFISAYQAPLDLPIDALQSIANGRMKVRYTDYDWGLNRAP